ncbi:MAG: serine hydrolase [Acidobacteriota bacterium]
MKRLSIPLLLVLLFPASSLAQQELAQQEEAFDYWQFDKAIVWRGVQALMLCNGLFTSNRSLDQIVEQELAYVRGRPGTVEGDDFVIDTEKRAVAVGLSDDLPAMRAAYREGLGCIILPPDQTFDHIPDLPLLKAPPLAGDAAQIPWPDGDLLRESPWPLEIDKKALQAAVEWAFDRKTHGTTEQVTISLMVVHKGRILAERYAPGVDYLTKTRTWSTAKSIAVTLIGMLVDQGKLRLDEALGIDWLPRARSPETDPRSKITLRHLLNMSSGLYPVDNGLEYATGSGLAYWAGASSIRGARNRALIRAPGTNWDYENYDTLLAVYAMKRAIGDDQAYLEFPRSALLDKIGMRNTIPGVDRFGDFIMSSQIYTNARDLARFGLLYLNGGVWNGERLISEKWIEFVRTPAPSTKDRGNFYGAQWWLVPDNRTDVPSSAYSTAGNRGQYVIAVPSHELVIVRRGLDFGRQGFNRWDLTAEVLKAFSGE